MGRWIADAELNRLLILKVARDRKGVAPNRPLLVLVILDLVEPAWWDRRGGFIRT